MITVNLSKEKKTVLVDLSKGDEKAKDVRVNLQWDAASDNSSGFFSKLFSSNKAIDLDLGCLYELNDGSKGTIQALGKRFGSVNSAPYIALDKDDRSGESTDGEWLTISGEFWKNIKRVLVYAFIYDGVPNWTKTNGTITMYVNDEVIQVEMDEADDSQRLCGVVLLENEGGKFKTTRVVRYFQNQEYLDKAFGWNLNWVSGSKD